MLALGTAVLLDGRGLPAARGEDSVVERTVEELLRYLSVVQIAFPRFPKTDSRSVARPSRRASGRLPPPRRQS